MTLTMATRSENRTGCLDSDQLERYASGWMNEAEYERTDLHVSGCRYCQSQLAAIPFSTDALTESLRDCTTDQIQSAESPIVQGAIQAAGDLMSVDPEVPSEVWEPTQSIGAYDLISALGRGGMGTVYLARHRELGKRVAIKLLPTLPSQREEVRARFAREIQAVGSLDDPRIVAATDAGQVDGTRFLVMEHVAGLDLSRLCRHVGRLRISDACDIARQVAQGLSTAHAAGVVHRDIKPSNLMLNESGQVKILDFGLAQLGRADDASLELTTVGQLLGTLDYMAPEQAERSGVVDYRADLYSLGATLFRLLAGRAPLAASPDQSPLEKLRLLANHSAPKISSLRDDVPEVLVKLIAELLDSRPEHRPPSPAHVAEQLEQFAEGSDLPALLRCAQEREAINPASSAIPSQLRTKLTSPGSDSPRRGFWLRWLLVPLLIFGGIVLTIETQKGNIVIQSDVAGVQVNIVKDGETVEGVTIKQEPTSTRLRAGKYEVIIDGATDNLMVENGSVTLTRRGTHVVTITEKPKTSPQPTPRREDVSTSGPTYEDKTLADWVDVVRRERSPERLYHAFQAIDRLATQKKHARVVTEALLTWFRASNGSESFRVGDRPHHIDRDAFALLWNVNEGKPFYEVLAGELEVSDESQQARLLQRGYVREPENDDWAPLLKWLKLQLNRISPDELKSHPNDPIMLYLLTFLGTKEADEDEKQEIVDYLTKEALATKDNAVWWQGLGPTRDSNGSSQWPQIDARIHRQSIRFLRDSDDASHISQAAMYLRSSRDLAHGERVVVGKAIEKQLQRLTDSDDLLTLSLVPDNYNSEVRMRTDVVSTQWTRRNGDYRDYHDNPGMKANAAIELLDLARHIGWTDELDAVLSGLEEKLGMDSTVTYRPTAVSWPSLVITEHRNGWDDDGFNVLRQLHRARVPGYEQSALRVLIHLHPVLADRRKQE